ncbi:zinc-binding alcohol dehydrogenase family protein [Listeria welshimeri]|uniref:zinc-binding alcohol dehydrogenase family protein n=1 Tax=Listeria welshimeri TaxID=1643 RepID=UPI0016295EE4|nr:zinc-binding alcohol dehydrogenase family protein [Listeria welshimeri]MBC1356026.1 zinc-binding alcohol dehydrogenase family protein [Listeria welshimeri]MBC1768511.1 zinc-binding alcohol dehydrogenase family protein [Listeria welshimeri]MBC1785741.1 zinc-binding alcohol dehydrogenase family protein [Listeria welshimeri]MBC2082903.1 zinc-binding alcohol dehydrogenase family protein [Listeria welshimeri]MBF2457452.1 zinc-binding alcohol dehydrogenase family protein [Listeria welshimeri]
MKAVGLTKKSTSFVDLEIAQPVPENHDLLVQIKAISINPVDTKQREATKLKEEEVKILGWDAVGEVVDTGSKVSLFKTGQEVYFAGDVTRPGSYAEFTLIDERLVGLKPKKLSLEEAAAMPLTTITAWEALVKRLGITEDDNGKSILIINGAGGVGSIATQLAANMGLEVISTASRPETIEWTQKHGANYVINHREDITKQLANLGFEKGVDFILCLHDTNAHWDEMQKAIRPQGKICSIVELSKPVEMSLLKDKSATFSYEFMFTRSKYDTEDKIKQHEILTEAARMLDIGALTTTLNKVLSPINAATIEEAHRIISSGKMIGKLVVKGFD